MTAQASDIMILDGKAHPLLTTPLDVYLKRINFRLNFSMRCSANHRGYVARWEIFDHRLFLTGLFGGSWIVPPHILTVLPPDPEPFEPTRRGEKSLRLADLFPDQAPLVPATWVTMRLVVPTGRRMVYMHMGFGSLYATYSLIRVVKGHVRRIRNMDGREWSLRTRRHWPDVEWLKGHPHALMWEEAETDDYDDEELPDWRQETEHFHQWSTYEAKQVRDIEKPCGFSPRF